MLDKNDTNCSFASGSSRAMFSVILICSVLLCAGCRPAAEDPGKERPASGKSSGELLIDGITGKYAVDAGKQAKADIQAITEKQNARLEEVLEE